MTTRNLFLAAFTVLVVGVCIALPFVPQSIQPFTVLRAATSDPNDLAMEIRPAADGTPLPAGLQAGDRTYFRDMSPETRSFFMAGTLNPPIGTRVDLPIRRADGIHHVDVEYGPSSFLGGGSAAAAATLAGYAMMLLEAALGLLLLWRGRSQASLGVALWCFASMTPPVLGGLPLPEPYSNILDLAITVLEILGASVGFYLVADGLTATVRPAARRRLTHALFAAVILTYALVVAEYNVRFYRDGTNLLTGIGYIVALHFAGYVISLSIMLLSYRRCKPVDQARIRWVLFSLLGVLLAYGFQIGFSALNLSVYLLIFGTMLLQAATLSGLTYTVLKHQLVSLQLVLNRALVYGLMTSLVVGVFAAMLSFLEHETLNTETNRLLALLVPLVLGMGLDTIKRQVNAYIGKAFFRKRHESQAALAQFARTCGHIDDAGKLLDLTADELFRHGGPQALGIYLTSPQTSGAAITRQRGENPCPPKLDSNDLAFLRLKTGDAEVNLLNVGSKLGQDGLVYGLQVRSQLLGCIYLGPRPAEAYSTEERQLFERVAHQVAVALHALRLDEQRKLLEELADGAFNSLPTAQAKAKELIGAAG